MLKYNLQEYLDTDSQAQHNIRVIYTKEIMTTTEMRVLIYADRP